VLRCTRTSFARGIRIVPEEERSRCSSWPSSRPAAAAPQAALVSRRSREDAAEDRNALALVRRDRRFQELVRGVEWHAGAGEVGLSWSTADARHGGSVIDVELEEPLDVKGFDWPLYLESPYRPTTRCHDVEDVTALTLRIDDELRRVVEIGPHGEHARIDGRPAVDYFDTYPEGC
jgi:hypothetical protein